MASCAETGPPARESDPNATATIDLVPADDRTTSGTWASAGSPETPLTEFHTPTGKILFSVGCDMRGGLLLQRHGFVARANVGLMQFRTGADVRRLAVTTTSGDQPLVQARAPYNDQMIPALIRYDKPLEVRVEGLETLILPPSPAVRKLVRTCQQNPAPDRATTASGSA